MRLLPNMITTVYFKTANTLTFSPKELEYTNSHFNHFWGDIYSSSH